MGASSTSEQQAHAVGHPVRHEREHEGSLRLQHKYTEAAAKAREISKLDKLDPGTKKTALERAKQYEELALRFQAPILAFQKNPASLTHFKQAVRAYYEQGKTKKLALAIEKFTHHGNPTNRDNLAAIQNAYGLVGNWEAKLKTDNSAIWNKLAEILGTANLYDEDVAGWADTVRVTYPDIIHTVRIPVDGAVPAAAWATGRICEVGAGHYRQPDDERRSDPP